MTSKLCAHFQRQAERGAEATEAVRESAMPWVKGIDVQTWHCTAHMMFPRQQVLARIYMPQKDEAAYVAQGTDGARRYVQQLQPVYDKLRTGGVVAVEGPNEHYPDWAHLGAYISHAVEWIKLTAARGLRPAWVTSTGLPGLLRYNDQAKGPTARDLAPIWAALYTYDGIWCPHEYGAPTMRGCQPWLTLRYRDIMHELATVSESARQVPIIISECGVDGGVLKPPKMGQGWKRFLNREAYQAELVWYDSELCRDAQVIAATPFTTCPTSEWSSFDVDGAMLKWMAARYGAPTPEPPPPPPVTPPPELDLVDIAADIEGMGERMLSLAAKLRRVGMGS